MRTHVAEDTVIKSAPIDNNIKDVVEWLNSFDEVYTRFSCEGDAGTSNLLDTAMVMFFCSSLTQLSIICKELRNYGEIKAEFFQGSLRFCLRFHCSGCFTAFKENLANGWTNDNCDYCIQQPVQCLDHELLTQEKIDEANFLKELANLNFPDEEIEARLLNDTELKERYVLAWYSLFTEELVGEEDVYLTQSHVRNMFYLPETDSAIECYDVTARQRDELINLVETHIDLNNYIFQLEGRAEKDTSVSGTGRVENGKVITETGKTWRNEDEFEFHDVINKGLDIQELMESPTRLPELSASDEQLDEDRPNSLFDEDEQLGKLDEEYLDYTDIPSGYDNPSRFHSVLNDVKAMTPEEFKVSLRQAGIIDDNDELMPQYKSKKKVKSSQIVQPIVESVVPKDFIDASKECCNNPQLPQPTSGCKQIDLSHKMNVDEQWRKGLHGCSLTPEDFAKERGICITATNKHVMEMTDDFQASQEFNACQEYGECNNVQVCSTQKSCIPDPNNFAGSGMTEAEFTKAHHDYSEECRKATMTDLEWQKRFVETGNAGKNHSKTIEEHYQFLREMPEAEYQKYLEISKACQTPEEFKTSHVGYTTVSPYDLSKVPPLKRY